MIFAGGILGIVTYLGNQGRRHRERRRRAADTDPGQVRERGRGDLLQTVVVSVLILATAATGYTMRTAHPSVTSRRPAGSQQTP